MTRIVRTTYRYKRPPGKRKAVTLEVPAVITAASKRRRVSDEARAALAASLEVPEIVTIPREKLRHVAAIEAPTIVRGERVAKGVTSERPEVTASVVQPAKDDRRPAIVTAKPKRRLPDGPPLPMELPLSRKPVERDDDDYKRLKDAMARRLRSK